MCLSYDLFDNAGRVLINGGATLTQGYINKLKRLGFPGLYISDTLSSGIVVNEIIPASLRNEAQKSVKQRDVKSCRSISEVIIKEIVDRADLSINMADLRGYDDYTYAHSVNVAVLSSIIGYGLDLDEDSLRELALAAMLHDIGKQDIPAEIMNKPGRLTPQEYQIMKTHAQKSYDYIKDRNDVPTSVKKAVLNHHENLDGSGYPNGKDELELFLYERIIHVADVYDALTATRPYKKAYSSFEASEYLMGGCGTMFDKRVVESLLKYVPLYPKGEAVITSDGRQAIINDNTDLHNLRPIIRLMDGTDLDLLDDKNLNITIQPMEEDISDVMIQAEKERQIMIRESKTFKIMVLDYHEDDRVALRKVLSGQYDIVTMKSISQALIYLDHNRKPDLLLVDINIPEKDGVRVAEKIREKVGPALPIIFLTALRDKESVMSCRRLGAASYILKPFQPVFLKSEVKRVLTGESDTE